MPEDPLVYGVLASSRKQQSLRTRTSLVPNDRRLLQFGGFLPHDVEMRVNFRTPMYGQMLRNAFDFFRLQSEGHYSSSTLMKLRSAADNQQTSTRGPIIVTAALPNSYDEDTEIKKGGLVGMVVVERDGRTLVSVHSRYRQKGIGTALLGAYTYVAGDCGGGLTETSPFFWVHTRNLGAQIFLLKGGSFPTTMTSNGAVRYASQPPAEGTEAS